MGLSSYISINTSQADGETHSFLGSQRFFSLASARNGSERLAGIYALLEGGIVDLLLYKRHFSACLQAKVPTVCRCGRERARAKISTCTVAPTESGTSFRHFLVGPVGRIPVQLWPGCRPTGLGVGAAVVRISGFSEGNSEKTSVTIKLQAARKHFECDLGFLCSCHHGAVPLVEMAVNGFGVNGS